MHNEIGNAAAWWGIGGVILGAFLSGFFTHYLTKDRDATARRSILDRERDLRRRAFRKFLCTFRSRMDRTDDRNEAGVWIKYTELAPEFRGESALVDGDFLDVERFTVLVETVGGWRIQDLRDAARKRQVTIRDVICDSIDELLAFTKKNAD